MLGEFPLVGFERGADQVMDPSESEFLHLFQSFVGGPAFHGHAIRGDGHSGAIVTETAMHENFSARIVVDHPKKAGESGIAGEGAMPGD